MAEQRRKLMATLAVVIGSLHSLSTILPAVSTLAKKHVEYGVKPDHYASVGAALLWTLERGLGASWTPEIAAAWTSAYVTLSDFMIARGLRPQGRGGGWLEAACPAISLPNRSAISKASPPACRSRAPGAAWRAASLPRAVPSGPDAEHIAAQDRDRRCRRQAHRPGEDQARAASVRRLCAAEGAGGEQRIPQARRQFPLEATTACSTSRRRRTPTCAGCGCRTASSSTGSFAASPISPSATAAAIRMSPRAPTCRSARSSRRTRSRCSKAIQDLGLCSRGSGADNIRNVTGTPTAGIDPQELIDTRPYAREWHFHILNERALYGLPRKFNVAFDGAGTDRRCWRTPTTSASRRSR